MTKTHAATPLTRDELLAIRGQHDVPEHAPPCITCGRVLVLVQPHGGPTATATWTHLHMVDTHTPQPAGPDTPQPTPPPTVAGDVTTIPVTPRSTVTVMPGITGNTCLMLDSAAVSARLAMSLTPGQVAELGDALAAVAATNRTKAEQVHAAVAAGAATVAEVEDRTGHDRRQVITLLRWLADQGMVVRAKNDAWSIAS